MGSGEPAPLIFEQLFARVNPMDYPNGTFVSFTLELPHHGQLVVRDDESMGRHRVLWTCQHDHPTGAEASACAGREIGRDGVLPPR
jgi:hypothetical protein